MKAGTDSEWFNEWFDCPYYQILYKNRDVNEASLFLENMLNFLDPASNRQNCGYCLRKRQTFRLPE